MEWLSARCHAEPESERKEGMANEAVIADVVDGLQPEETEGQMVMGLKRAKTQ